METVLTTLDPGMKEFLNGDGVVEVYVGTQDPLVGVLWCRLHKLEDPWKMADPQPENIF